MSTNHNDDYELFMYYLNNGHLPIDFRNKNVDLKVNRKKDIKLVDNKKKDKSSNYSDINKKIEEYNLEKEEAVWIEYLKNSNFSNYEKIVYPKRQTHNNIKKVKLDKITPNATLDLHGTKYKDAKRELDAFFNRYTNSNYNCVLIIHGKGYGSENGMSVLKSLVEDYLSENKDIYKIKKYIEAPNNLGGSGAKIVFFR